MDEMRKQVADIHKILTGNGHPEEGLVYKVRLNTDFRNFWVRFGWLVLAGILSPTFILFLIGYVSRSNG